VGLGDEPVTGAGWNRFGQEDLGWSASLDSESLMGSLVIVPVQVELQVVVERLDRAVDLLAEGWDVKLMQQGLMKPFCAAVGPSVTWLNESQLHAQAAGQVVEWMTAFTTLVSPTSRGVLGPIILQQGLNTSPTGLGHQVMFEEVAGVLGLAGGVDLDHSEARGNIDGQVVVNVAEVLEPSDQKGVLAPHCAGAGSRNMPSFRGFPSRFQFCLGDDLTEFNACPLLAVAATADAMPAQDALHAVVADSNLISQLIGNPLGTVSRVVAGIGQDASLVFQASSVRGAPAWLAAHESDVAAGLPTPSVARQRLTTGRTGTPAKRPLTDSTRLKSFQNVQPITLSNGMIRQGDLLGCGGTCGNAPS